MTNKTVIIFLTAVLLVVFVSWFGRSFAGIGLDVGRTFLSRSPNHGRRVACVGDSITFGAGIKNRRYNSYPAQLASRLAKRLGEDYQVRNFGVNGATLLKAGDLPYWQQKAYEQALKFAPNVVVIKLGTNDTKPQNWRYGEAFVADYVELVQSFQALETQPEIWLCTPVPAYAALAGIEEQVIVQEVIPQVRQVAEATGAKLIDLYGALSDRPHLFPDGIHPNAEGAGLMAEAVGNAIAVSPAETLTETSAETPAETLTEISAETRS